MSNLPGTSQSPGQSEVGGVLWDGEVLLWASCEIVGILIGQMRISLTLYIGRHGAYLSVCCENSKDPLLSWGVSIGDMAVV